MFSFPDASRALGSTPYLLNPSYQITGASLDTRTLSQGDIFIALRGAHLDGHAYLEEAFRKGASGALLEEQVFKKDQGRFLNHPETFHNLLPVRDPQQALTDLARWWRSQFQFPTVGITGSVGKTSTKEFLYYLLSKKNKGLANAGNFNNHLGLPLTLLRMNSNHRFCVAELGASHSGEIQYLADLLKPTAGMITQISAAHLEGFGSLEDIYEAKLELFDALPAGAPAILPDDDPKLFQKAKPRNLNLVRVGMSRDADFRISNVVVENGYVRFRLNDQWTFSFPGIASFFARNAAMAVAAAISTGISLKEIPEVWQDFKLPSGRFQERLLEGGIRVIYDGYNANPSSFQKALEAFSALPVSGRKILVFADMLELGTEARRLHEELGRQITSFNFDCVVAYGSNSKASIQAGREESRSMLAEHFKNADETADYLNHFIRPGDCILLKASRGMKIEQVMKSIEKMRDTPLERQEAKKF